MAQGLFLCLILGCRYVESREPWGGYHECRRYLMATEKKEQIVEKNAGMGDLAASFAGPMAVAFDFADSPVVAKILTDHLRTSKSLMAIKGGFLGDRVLNTKEVETLAKLPSRQVLLSQALAGM